MKESKTIINSIDHNKNISKRATPYEKYEALAKVSHKLKNKHRDKNFKIKNILIELEKLTCLSDVNLRNSLKYAHKLFSKKNGK